MTGGEQSVDDQSAGSFNDHRQGAGRTVMAQAVQRLGQARFGVLTGPPLKNASSLVKDGDVVCRAGPVPPDKLHDL
jgi:hypothetical protein